MTDEGVIKVSRGWVSIVAALMGILAMGAGAFSGYVTLGNRVGELERLEARVEEEHARRITALESVSANHTTDLQVLKTELDDIRGRLAEIHGQLSGATMPVRGRVP